MTDGKALQREKAAERRAAELRENLRRRKAQARARVRSEGGEAASPNSAGIAADKRKDETG